MIGEGLDGKVTEREAMPRLPTSGQIMGALVAGLGIKHPRPSEQNGTPLFLRRPGPPSEGLHQGRDRRCHSQRC